jgi:hypothetical protein
MNSRHPLLVLALVVGLLLIEIPAPAAEDPAPLTEKQVRSLLASLPEVETLGNKYEDLEDPLPTISGDENEDPSAAMQRMRSGMLSSSLGALKGHAGWKELEGIAKTHGFASVAEWANVGDRVMAGFIQMQLATEAPEAEQQMLQAREEIASNPDIPEAQKEMILQQLETQMDMFEALRSSTLLVPGDLEVLEPMAEEIRAAFERG